MTHATCPFTQAFVGWIDEHEAFCVLLAPAYPPNMTDEEAADFDEEAVKLEQAYSGDSPHARLYRAAYVANPKDFKGEIGRIATWPKETQAVRAAKAINKEIARWNKGEPVSDQVVANTAAIMRILS